MKKMLFLLAAALPALAQQNFDFKTLDKLSAKAKESNNITLDGDTLKLATGLLSDDQDSVKALANNLTAVYVRNYEFERDGQYEQSDLDPFRIYVTSLQWSKIVDVKEDKETSQIYVKPLPNNLIGGIAIINAEPREVSVVYITGMLSLSDISKLSGNVGIPDMKFLLNGKPDKKATGKK